MFVPLHVLFHFSSCFIINIRIWTIIYARSNENYVLELDFEPFNATFPRPTRSSSIGNGVQFLNRHLSSIMFRNKESLEPLVNFLRAHKHDGRVSLLELLAFSECTDYISFYYMYIQPEAYAFFRIYC